MIPWCGPCVLLAPEFKKLAKKYANVPNLKFVKFNVDNDKNGKILNKYQVTGIPVVHYFDKGGWRPSLTVVGFMGNPAVIESSINHLIKGTSP